MQQCADDHTTSECPSKGNAEREREVTKKYLETDDNPVTGNDAPYVHFLRPAIISRAVDASRPFVICIKESTRKSTTTSRRILENAGRYLVKEDAARIGQQRLSDRDTLLLAAAVTAIASRNEEKFGKA